MTKDELSPVAVVVLGQLVRGDQHAYEVFRTLKQHGEERRVRLTVGAVYHAVDRLERDQMVRATGTDREGARPERTTYAITALGRAAYLRNVRALVEQPRTAYPAFEIGLSQISALDQQEALEVLGARQATLTERLADLRSRVGAVLAAGLPERFLVDGDFEIHQLAGEIAWLAATIDAIETGRLDWAKAKPAGLAEPIPWTTT